MSIAALVFNLQFLALFCSTGSEVINKNPFSTQLRMKFFLLINVKMPTIVGILTFMSRKNSILDLAEPENAEFLDILYLGAFKISCLAGLSMKFYHNLGPWSLMFLSFLRTTLRCHTNIGHISSTSMGIYFC